MPILKKRQIEQLAQMNGEEIEAFLGNLPASKDEIEDLFDYLEMRLAQSPCNHTLNFAMQFIMNRKLNFPKITSWLNENAGYCDCKVVESIVPEWRKTFE